MDKIRNGGDAKRVHRHPGYAHFPGTGPEGRQCRHCVFLTAKNRCAKATALTGHDRGAIDKYAAACRYFVERTDLGLPA
jgi:hypothetical protein